MEKEMENQMETGGAWESFSTCCGGSGMHYYKS